MSWSTFVSVIRFVNDQRFDPRFGAGAKDKQKPEHHKELTREGMKVYADMSITIMKIRKCLITVEDINDRFEKKTFKYTSERRPSDQKLHELMLVPTTMQTRLFEPHSNKGHDR